MSQLDRAILRAGGSPPRRVPRPVARPSPVRAARNLSGIADAIRSTSQTSIRPFSSRPEPITESARLQAIRATPLSGAARLRSQGAGRSILDQTLEQPWNFAKGIFELATVVPGTAIGAGQLAIDALPGGKAPTSGEHGWRRHYFQDLSDLASGLREETRQLYSLGVGQLAPGGAAIPNPLIPDVVDPGYQRQRALQDFKQASDEGRTVDYAVNKMGLAAAGAGGGGAILSRLGRVPTTTATAGRAATLADRARRFPQHQASGRTPTTVPRGTTGNVIRRAEMSRAPAPRQLRINLRSLEGRPARLDVPLQSQFRTPRGLNRQGTPGWLARGAEGSLRRRLAPIAAELGEQAKQVGYQADWLDPGVGLLRTAARGGRRLRDIATAGRVAESVPPRGLEKLLDDHELRRETWGQIVDAQSDAERFAVFNRNLADRLDLPDKWRRLVLLSTSDAWRGTFDMLDEARARLAPDEFNTVLEETIRRVNDGVETPTMHLTVDDYNTWRRYADGDIPDRLRQDVDTVRQAVLETIAARTRMMETTGRLDPDQTGDTYVRRHVEQIAQTMADETARRQEQAAPLRQRADEAARNLSMHEAFYDHVPEPGARVPTDKSLWSRRLKERASQRAAAATEQRAQLLEAELATKQARLEQRIRNRGQATDDLSGLDAEAARLKTEIDMIKDQLDALYDMDDTMLANLEDGGEGIVLEISEISDALDQWTRQRAKIMRQRRQNDAYRLERDRPRVGEAQEAATEARSVAEAAVREADEATKTRQSADSTDLDPDVWRRREDDLSPGETMNRDIGAAREAARAAEAEAGLAEWRAAQSRVRELRLGERLDRSRQDRLRAIQSKTLGKMRNVIVEWRADRLGELDRGHISGLMGELAGKYGFQELARRYMEQSSRHMRRNNLIGTRPGETSTSLMGFYRAMEESMAPISDTDMRRLNQAIMADDLLEVLRVGEDTSDGLMSGVALFDMVQSRFDTFRDHNLSGQLEADIQALIDGYNQDRWKVLSDGADDSLKVMPGRYRRVALNTIKGMEAFMSQADEAWNDYVRARDAGDLVAADIAQMKYRAFANAAETVPTTLEAMKEAGYTPAHLVGGAASPGGATPYQRGRSGVAEVRDPSSQQRLRSGRIELDFDEYTRREAREIAQIQVSEALKAIATDDRFSLGLIDLLDRRYDNPRLADQVTLDDWYRVNTDPPSLRWMARQAELRGYRVVANTYGPDRAARLTDPMSDIGARVDEIVTGERMEGPQAPTEPTLADIVNQVTGVSDTLGYQIIPEELAETVRLGDDTAAIRVIPTDIADEILDWQNPTRAKGRTLYDQATQIFKTAVLPLNPEWLANNFFGNAIMATVTGAASPRQIVTAIGDVLGMEAKAIENYTGQPVSRWQAAQTIRRQGGFPTTQPGRLGSHGLTYQEIQGARRLADPSTRMGRVVASINDPRYNRARTETTGRRRPVRQGLSNIVQGSYALNEFTDNMFRSALFNVKLEQMAPKIPDRLLEADGMRLRRDLTPAERAEVDAIYTKAEDIYTDSINQTLATLGDFTRLTRFERNVVKRILPFYPWLRHQALISLRLPFQAPMRYAMLSAIGETMKDDDQGRWMNELFGIGFPVGDRHVSLAGAMPYSSPFELSLDPTTGSTAARAVNPVATVPIAALTNWDIAQGRQGSRPLNQRRLDLYGQRDNTTVFDRFRRGDVQGGLGELGHRVMDTTRLSSLARDLALTATPGTGYQGRGSRPLGASVLDSGDVSQYRGRDVSLLDAVLGGVGVFWPEDMTETERNARIRDFQRLFGQR